MVTEQWVVEEVKVVPVVESGFTVDKASIEKNLAEINSALGL